MGMFYVIHLIIGHIFIFSGLLIVRYPRLISGYNMLSKEKREQIDIKPVAQLMRRYMIAMGAGIMTLAPLFRWLGWGDYLSLYYIILIVGGCTLMIVHVHHKTRGYLFSSGKLVIGLTIGIAVLICGFIFYSLKEPRIEIENNQLTVSGLYGKEITLSSIEQVELLDALPSVEMRTNGFSLAHVHKGYFRLAGIPKALFFLQSNTPPYLVIHLSGEPPVFINRKSSEETQSLFNQLNR